MFAIANLMVLLISLVNMISMLLGKSPTIRDIALELVGTPNARERLRNAFSIAGLAQIYLISWVFPLKALNFHMGLAWACLMLLSVLESIHTGRKMLAVVAAEDREARFALHDSLAYRSYQLFFHVAIIGACAFLLWPR